MKLAALPLAFAFPALTFSQTPAAKPAVHRSATSASSTALPPNIPRATGLVKPLYALRYQDIRVGIGPLAPATVLGASQADSTIQFYTVTYTGWLARDGKKFDSSFDHPGAEPLTLPIGVHRVIPGWDTGFAGMHIGGKRRLFIPYQLAYGDSGSPIRGGGPQAVPPKSDLIFDVELVSVSDKPPVPKTPPAPPAGATPPPAGSAPVTPPKAATPDPTKPSTDPATNDPAKATTPDNATKPAPKPATNPPGN